MNKGNNFSCLYVDGNMQNGLVKNYSLNLCVPQIHRLKHARVCLQVALAVLDLIL